MKRISKSIWKGLLLVNLIIILFYWWQGSSDLLMSDSVGVAIAIGRLSGLLAAGTVLLQFVLIGRTPWLERTFGLDKLSRIHSLNGKFTLLFLILHPLLIIYGYSKASGISLLEQYKSFVFDYEYVNLAIIGLTLFIVVVISSLVIVRNKLRYETWYFTHLFIYLAVFTSFWHQIELGGTVSSSQFFYGYWIALYTIVIGAHVIFRFGRPVYLYKKHQFVVSRVVRETHDTVSVYFTGKKLNEFDVEPGQFMILRFLTKGMWWQAHPFSLSRVPGKKELRITVKELGDFTKQVSSLSSGTKVMIDGPYGIFSEWVSVSPKVLFIAGGIGITPIRSLMEEMLKKGKDVVLLYGNKKSEDIVFKDEIDELAVSYSVNVVHVLSAEESYQGETGMIDKEKIKRLVPDIEEREVYLCGPSPMMDSIIGILNSINIPSSKVHYERFSL